MASASRRGGGHGDAGTGDSGADGTHGARRSEADLGDPGSASVDVAERRSERKGSGFGSGFFGFESLEGPYDASCVPGTGIMT